MINLFSNIREQIASRKSEQKRKKHSSGEIERTFCSSLNKMFPANLKSEQLIPKRTNCSI